MAMAATEYDDHVLNWQEGDYGKGVVDRSGNVHTWNDDEFGLHRDYLDHAGLDNALGYFTIYPDGAIHPAGADNLDIHMADVIVEADPRHYHDLDQPHDWNFSKVATGNWWDKTFEFYRGREPKQADTIELVPLAALEAMVEWDRRPDASAVTVQGEQVQPGADPEYYEALKNEMATEGQKEPIVVEYNIDTGYGHIGEGNHRIAVARDLGQQALPTTVFCSSRKSNGKELFLREPREVAQEEARANGNDPEYYSQPSYGWMLAPSRVGLPTV
jgi:hypothetical protein